MAADFKNTMWCVECQQDVPALPLGDRPGFRCAGCGRTIRVDQAEPAALAPAYDSWELDEQLRQIERVLQGVPSHCSASAAKDRCETSRLDLSHCGPTAWHVGSPSLSEPRSAWNGKSKTVRSERGSTLGSLAWFALSVGTAGFVCGGILLGWSFATDRQDLLVIGLPAALAGQVALLVGLMLQLNRFWRINRKAIAKLDNVDAQLHEIRGATTLLQAAGETPKTVGRIDRHSLDGVSPLRLLSDLKNQIDLLATKIAGNE